jgi:hypothetical protein
MVMPREVYFDRDKYLSWEFSQGSFWHWNTYSSSTSGKFTPKQGGPFKTREECFADAHNKGMPHGLPNLNNPEIRKLIQKAWSEKIKRR